MKQIITIKLQMNDETSRSKAMAIATRAEGTITCVKIEGPERDRLVITGKNIDSVKLTRLLRKKFPKASIESVRPVIDGQNYDDYDDNYHYRYRRTLPNYEPYYNCPPNNNPYLSYGAVPVYDPDPRGCNIT